MIASILMALFGGALIGLAASVLLIAVGRVCGISGIVGGLLSGWDLDSRWRFTFLFGLMAGGALLMAAAPQVFQSPTGRSIVAVALAGALVGVGTRLGSGCTSGHGVCGLSRLAPRSLAATSTFMGAGFVTATLMGLLTGGA